MKKIFSILILLFSLGLVFSFGIPKPDWFVTDQAWILSSEQKQNLENILQTFEKETSTEIALLTINTTDGEDISMLATDIGQQWWVGKKWKDNWIMILIAVQDRKRFIAVWYWLEWVITDAITKKIWENDFPGYFKQWKYYDWMSSAINDLKLYILKDPETIANYNTTESISTSDSSGNSIIIILILWWLIWSILKSSGKKIWNKFLWSFVWWVILAIVAFIFLSSILAIILSFLWIFIWLIFWFDLLNLLLLFNWRWSSGWGGFGWSSGWSFGWFGWWSFGWWGSWGSR